MYIINHKDEPDPEHWDVIKELFPENADSMEDYMKHVLSLGVTELVKKGRLNYLFNCSKTELEEFVNMSMDLYQEKLEKDGKKTEPEVWNNFEKSIPLAGDDGVISLVGNCDIGKASFKELNHKRLSFTGKELQEGFYALEESQSHWIDILNKIVPDKKTQMQMRLILGKALAGNPDSEIIFTDKTCSAMIFMMCVMGCLEKSMAGKCDKRMILKGERFKKEAFQLRVAAMYKTRIGIWLFTADDTDPKQLRIESLDTLRKGGRMIGKYCRGNTFDLNLRMMPVLIGIDPPSNYNKDKYADFAKSIRKFEFVELPRDELASFMGFVGKNNAEVFAWLIYGLREYNRGLANGG